LNELSTTPNDNRSIPDERWIFYLRVNAIIGTLVVLTSAVAGCGGGADQLETGVAKTISGEELQARLGTPNVPVIFDVRTSGEFASGHIPGAIHIPHTQVSRRLKELEGHRDREIVVYCTRGPRAYSAESVLRKAGFDKVRHLRGDITGWRRDGRPVTR
jgi:rhodanese-related sulfurtransferase